MQLVQWEKKKKQAQLTSHFLKYQAARVKPLHTAEFLVIDENLYGASGAESNTESEATSESFYLNVSDKMFKSGEAKITAKFSIYVEMHI